VPGFDNGFGYYCVVDAVPGSSLESISEERRPGLELSNWLSRDRQHHEIATCAATEVRWGETLEDVWDVPLNHHRLRALDVA
jgi:hypothetical protein